MSEKSSESLLLNSSSPGLNRLLAHNDLVFAAGLAIVLATLIIPLPTFLLDILLACSIAVAIATLVTVLAAQESTEFSAFPSLLLFVTLFRLSLNVASTRLILSNANAGQIIETFGQFVVGGNLIIGLVIFLILVIIQFVVITKGSERISEVAARFNLDAMPGKQMAIDADLAAGIIGEKDASARRDKIVRESEFYGAMDGASKFIRGDAIAGLIIAGINLVGGIIIGITNDMTASEAVKTYSILTVGDGLVTQIPALIISTASGFLISKASTKTNLAQDLVRQMLARSRPLGIASFMLAAMIFVPGFPKIPFIVLSIGAGLLSRTLGKLEREELKSREKTKEPSASDETPVEELLDVDKISVLVGPRLIKTIDPRRKNSLSQRIAPLRRKFVQQFGIILPLVRLRDNVVLGPNVYEIRLNNHLIGSGQLEPDKFLAMDPGTVDKPIRGQVTKEPVFNLPAIWIDSKDKSQAELSGYTVVDPQSVLITHLSEILRTHAHELLSHDDVQQLVDRLRERQPTLVNAVIGDNVSIGLLHRILQNLLKDEIPIRDLPQILESLSDHAARTKNPDLLTELVRKSLVRTISEQHSDAQGKILAITLAPELEYDFTNSLKREANAAESLAISPERALDFSKRVVECYKAAMVAGHDKTVLLCDYRLRPHLAAILSRQLSQLSVLAYDEITTESQIESVGTISVPMLEAQPVGAS